jgi:hypothetical protein
MQLHPVGKGVFDVYYGSTLDHFRRWLGTAGEGKTEDYLIDILVATLEASGFLTLYLKMANGYYAWLPGTPEGRLLPKLISRAKTAGIRIAGWHYVYNDYPNQEVTAATNVINAYLPDFWVIDAEGQAQGKSSAAAVYTSGLRRNFSKIPIGLCSYRYPSLHPQLPWAVYLAECQFHAPQVYWVRRAADDPPARQLANSYAELRRLKMLPVIPVGAAYQESAANLYWKPTAADMVNFDEACKTLELPGNSWFMLRDMFKFPYLWDATRAMLWSEPGTVPTKVLWSEATATQKDRILLQLAQAGGLVDDAGYLRLV